MASKHVVPEAKDAMNRFKMEAANELDVFLLLKYFNSDNRTTKNLFT